MTYTQLFRTIENELNKDKTDNETWNAVQRFWQWDGEVAVALLDRVALLENRMEREHGWKRTIGKFELV